jgi:hypothetical protein
MMSLKQLSSYFENYSKDKKNICFNILSKDFSNINSFVNKNITSIDILETIDNNIIYKITIYSDNLIIPSNIKKYFISNDIEEYEPDNYGYICFLVLDRTYQVVQNFVEKFSSNIKIVDGNYLITIRNSVDDWYNTNLLAELHDVTFNSFNELKVFEFGGLGMSSFPIKYREKRYCDENYFSKYGYEHIGKYEQEKLDDYFIEQNHKEYLMNLEEENTFLENGVNGDFPPDDTDISSNIIENRV